MSELDALNELQRLCRLMLKPIRGYDTTGGWHLKECQIIQRHPDGDVNWELIMRDTRLVIYKTRTRDGGLFLVFNRFGVLSKGSAYSFVVACELLATVQKFMILDALAGV